MDEVEKQLEKALLSDDPLVACRARCVSLLDLAYQKYVADEIALGSRPAHSLDALTSTVAYLLSCHIARCTADPAGVVALSKQVAEDVERSLATTALTTALHKLKEQSGNAGGSCGKDS